MTKQSVNFVRESSIMSTLFYGEKRTCDEITKLVQENLKPPVGDENYSKKAIGYSLRSMHKRGEVRRVTKKIKGKKRSVWRLNDEWWKNKTDVLNKMWKTLNKFKCQNPNA